MLKIIKAVASVTYKLGRPAANLTYKVAKSVFGIVIIGVGSTVKTTFKVKK